MTRDDYYIIAGCVLIGLSKRAEDFQLYLARVEAEKIARLFAWVPKLLVLYAALVLFVWWVLHR